MDGPKVKSFINTNAPSLINSFPNYLILNILFYCNEFEILGPDLIEPCANSTMITSPNKQSVILLGCKENPESLYELIKTKGAFSWKKMSQKLTYSRYSTVAFLREGPR